MADARRFDNEKDERYWYEHEATEEEWYSWYKNVERPRYEHPDVTIDCVMVTFDENEREPLDMLKILTIRRFTHPFMGEWTLPGTFLHSDENADAAIARMLVDRLDFDTKGHAIVQQLQTFTRADRDPRGQVVSIANIVYVRDGISLINGIDGVEWLPIGEVLESHLGFDHDLIVDTAVERMRSQFSWTPNIFYALPEKFTLTDAIKLRASLFQTDWTKTKRNNFKTKFSPMWNELPSKGDDGPKHYRYRSQSK